MALANNDLFIVQKPGTKVHYKIKLSELSDQIAETHGDLWDRTGTDLSPVNTGDSVLIGGTLPDAPNITLSNTGNVDAKTFNTLIFDKGKNDLSTNIAIGTNGVLNNITTGAANTAIGANVLKLNEDGSKNTAVGNKALTANVSGSNNTAIGQLALTASTAADNTAVGMSAGAELVGGEKTTLVGKDALRNNVTGNLNTCIGYQAGYFCEGSSNTILGAYRGSINDVAINNTVVISAGNTERMRIDSTGSLLFGGTLPLAPNFELNSNGGAIFNGSGQFGGNPDQGAAEGVVTRASGLILVCRNGGLNVFAGFQQGTTVATSAISASGDARFDGKITSASTESTDSDTTLVTKDYLDDRYLSLYSWTNVPHLSTAP